jgi:hypothetical protein
MRLLGKEYNATRGTCFSINYEHLVDPNGAPFIISSELQNPYIIFMLVDDMYEHNQKRRVFIFNDCSHIPRFYNTVPQDGANSWPLSWGAMESGTLSSVSTINNIDAKAINPLTGRRPLEESVYYDTTTATYKYCRFTGTPYLWTVYEYNLQLTFDFNLDMNGFSMNELKDGTYYYAVHLIDGSKTNDMILEWAKNFEDWTAYIDSGIDDASRNPTLKPTYLKGAPEIYKNLITVTKLYKEPYEIITAAGTKFIITQEKIESLKIGLDRIDLECPLYEETEDIEIIRTNKFEIENFLKGGSKWLKI